METHSSVDWAKSVWNEPLGDEPNLADNLFFLLERVKKGEIKGNMVLIFSQVSRIGDSSLSRLLEFKHCLEGNSLHLVISGAGSIVRGQFKTWGLRDFFSFAEDSDSAKALIASAW